MCPCKCASAFHCLFVRLFVCCLFVCMLVICVFAPNSMWLCVC